jgi:hypothetical protein
VWLLRHGRPDDEYRFDLVAVEAGRSAPAIEYVPDAWRLESEWAG